MKEYINKALKEYNTLGKYPWHMPGHKRQNYLDGLEADSLWEGIFKLDYTEARDLDDMHKPKQFIKDSLFDISDVYGTYKSYMLVNGSTSGILSAIFAVTKPGDNVLVARNCHKSVYNAVELRGLNASYITPSYIEGTDILDAIDADKIYMMLNDKKTEGKKIAAVVITSPTYEGIISDIEQIAAIVHEYGSILIVDEAQGAHFEYTSQYTSAMRLGADIVIESLHKTMPSLTQTSLLHLTNSKLEKRVEKYMSIFQTSSPSYIFMQSMEKAIYYGECNRKQFDLYMDFLDTFRKRLDSLKHIILLKPSTDFDKGKLVLTIKKDTYITIDGRVLPFTGALLEEILADCYGQVAEMASLNYTILMTSVFDKEKAYNNLYYALCDIDSKLFIKESDECSGYGNSFHVPCAVIRPDIALDMDKEQIPLCNALDQVASEYVYAYPPGIPVLVPGERIDRQTINSIHKMVYGGLNVEGIIINDEREVYIDVIKEKEITYGKE